jgi:hypothetical protein
MAQHICWEVHRPRGGTWTCTEDNPIGFGADDLERLRRSRATTPENTIVKLRLSGDRPGRLYVFEFRWWRGTYQSGPGDPRPPRASAARA